LLLAFDDGEGESIVAFAADGLERGCVEAWVTAEAFEKNSGSGDACVGTGCIEDFAVADYVVSDDEGAGAREFECTFEVDGVVGLVGVEKDEVEGLGLVGVQPGEGFERAADPDVYKRRQAGALDVLSGDAGVCGIELECDETAEGRESAG
jgi:hypothetical protein